MPPGEVGAKNNWEDSNQSPPKQEDRAADLETIAEEIMTEAADGAEDQQVRESNNAGSFAGGPTAVEDIDTDQFFFEDNRIFQEALRDDLQTHDDDYRRRSGAGVQGQVNQLDAGYLQTHKSQAAGDAWLVRHKVLAKQKTKMKTMKNLIDGGGLSAFADLGKQDVDVDKIPEEAAATGGQAGPDQAGALDKISEGSDSFYLKQQRQRTLTRVPNLSKEERRQRIIQLKQASTRSFGSTPQELSALRKEATTPRPPGARKVLKHMNTQKTGLKLQNNLGNL